MRGLRVLAPAAILLEMGAACNSGGDNNNNNGGEGENIGRVSILNAEDPVEAQVLQGVIDKDINANADYVATLEANANFEEQIKIRVEGGNPPDIAMYPQPGSVIEQA